MLHSVFWRVLSLGLLLLSSSQGARANSQVAVISSALAGYSASASFTVGLAEPVEASYQWFKDGAPITAANAATLDIAAPSLADAGAYHVRVSNSAGVAISQPAALSIITQPEVIGQLPGDRVAAVGETIEFRVQASGKNLAYQWYKNGAILRQKTKPVLGLTALTAADAGTYSVKVTNRSGTVAMGVAILTVR